MSAENMREALELIANTDFFPQKARLIARKALITSQSSSGTAAEEIPDTSSFNDEAANLVIDAAVARAVSNEHQLLGRFSLQVWREVKKQGANDIAALACVYHAGMTHIREAMGMSYEDAVDVFNKAMQPASPPPEASDVWPKLETPARVGNTRFGVGVSARLVVECAQRRETAIRDDWADGLYIHTGMKVNPAALDASVDAHLDAVMKASGSALRNYSMQKTKDDMRAAMRRAMLAAPPAAPAVPDGCRLVPVRMTDDMAIAFTEAWFAKKRPIDDPEFDDAYAAMIAAAPEVNRG